MKSVAVFEGHELQPEPPPVADGPILCRLSGKGTTGRRVELVIGPDLFSKHVLLLGGIGSGKTNTMMQMVDQLRGEMSPNDVMLIFDTKGDYLSTFYRAGDIVISNDQHATGPDGEDYWNIFQEIGFDQKAEENITEIARVLFFEKTSRSPQPFFPNAARDLFMALLLHFHRTGGQIEPNNAVLRDFLDQSTSSALRSIFELHPDLRALTSYIADDRSPQTQGVVSELQQLVREIFIGNFRREGSLSMRKAIRSKGGRAIFVEYDLGVGEMLTPVYRLLLDLAIKEALCRTKSEGNVWFVIDEFRLIPNLQHVDNGVNFGRSLGAKFLIGIQNVEQLYHAYGESRARSILAGFSTTIAFRVNDFASRHYLQQLFGRNRKKDIYLASVQARGVVESVFEAHVVEDWDIASLPVGKAIIRFPGHQPFFFQFDRFKEA